MTRGTKERGLWFRPADLTLLLCTTGALFACGSGATSPGTGMVAEKICGQSPESYVFVSTVEELAKFSDCTVLVGHFQEDSVTALEDFSSLKNVVKIAGDLNVFRSPGFLTLHGLENLELVEGSLFVHLNTNLKNITA